MTILESKVASLSLSIYIYIYICSEEVIFLIKNEISKLLNPLSVLVYPLSHLFLLYIYIYIYMCVCVCVCCITTMTILIMQIQAVRTSLFLSAFSSWRLEERDTNHKSLCQPYYTDPPPTYGTYCGV